MKSLGWKKLSWIGVPLILMLTLVAFMVTVPRVDSEQPAQSAAKSPVTSTVKPDLKGLSPQTVKFIAFGDSGSGLSGQKNIAAQMFQQYQQEPFSFALMLGDNLYPDGNVKKYGEERFTKPYKPLLNKGVLFFAALGNHDVDSGFMADQIAFFKMPAAYYDVSVGNIQVFILNTNQFDATQKRWLADKLAKSNASWKIVAGHHPVYSSGLHGASKTLLKELKPLLEKHNVDLYLAGHDHNYERFLPMNGVTYIVSGGAGASLRGFHSPMPNSEVRLSKFHFLRFEVTPTTMIMKVIDPDGVILDQMVLEKSAKKASLKPAA